MSLSRPSSRALSSVLYSAPFSIGKEHLAHFQHKELAMKVESGSVFMPGIYENQLSKRQNCNGGQDMISELPDVIIGHILSFLPAKDAVRTSVLSKRWICLWTFITKLRFGDRDQYSSSKKSKMGFLNFVYRVLHKLNSSSIESFSLTISEKYNPCHVSKWISSAIDRSVKKVGVYSRKELNLSFHSLFQCKSLEELVWMMDDSCVSIVPVPSFGYCLSSLTVLKLSGIAFTCCDSNESKLLTLSFPVLRKYETKNCTWSGIEGVTLDVPLLEVVSIEYKPVLICASSYTPIKFCAPRLKEFTYIGYILPDTIVLDLSTAHIASAKIVPYKYAEDTMEETGILALYFVSQFNASVECLKLQPSKCLAHAKDFVEELPSFEMLSHLELDIVTGEILLALLQKTPSLKTLVLKRIIQFDMELLNSASVPACFLSTLGVVKFENFRGDEHELNLAKFVMENSLVLERLSVFPTWMLFGLNLENAKEQLFSFRKSSYFATIEICTV